MQYSCRYVELWLSNRFNLGSCRKMEFEQVSGFNFNIRHWCYTPLISKMMKTHASNMIHMVS